VPGERPTVPAVAGRRVKPAARRPDLLSGCTRGRAMRQRGGSRAARTVLCSHGRARCGVATVKQEVVASRAVVASNHPLASAAGVEVLARGGNAVDAAIATLFALTVVESMMVTPFGAGFFVIRDGRTGEVATIDNYATVP